MKKQPFDPKNLAKIGFLESNALLGSSPIGDDDLWYHHIPGTLCSVCLSVCLSLCLSPSPFLWASQLALPGGSSPSPPAGSRALPASSETFPAYSSAPSAGSIAISAGTWTLTANTETLPGGLREKERVPSYTNYISMADLSIRIWINKDLKDLKRKMVWDEGH